MNLQEAIQKVIECSQKYYETGESELSDKEFDSLLDFIKTLDPTNKILTEVGHGYSLKGIDEKEKFTHPIDVGSIEKAKTQDKVKDFIDEDSTFSTKIDGNSIVCYYKNGKLFKVVTRGSDNIGIDRTAKFINIVAKEIPVKGYVSVRGEAAIRKTLYTKENGFDVSKSSRNAVAGAISRKDDWESVFKFVDFVAYTFKDCDSGKDLQKEIPWNQYFIVEEQKKIPDYFFTDIERFKKEYKDDYPYEADGTVFKNGSDYLAYKFEDESAETRLKSIQWNIGKDQRLTPVAILEPVELAGATIERASLGSYSKALETNCWPVGFEHFVELVRANEIIPHIERTVKKSLETMYGDNPSCPVCNHKSEMIGEHAFCVNLNCGNIESSRLYNFSEQFYPEGLSDKIIEKFFEEVSIKTVFDLLEYKFPVRFPNIPGIGESHAEKILTFLKNISQEIDAKVIYKTFLLSCGERASEKIVESGFDLYSFFENSSEIDKLKVLSNFNSNIIEDILSKKDLMKKFSTLRKIVQKKSKAAIGSFCITGARFKPEQLQKILEAGWKEDSTIKRTTTILVVKDSKSNSSKTQKAKEYGIEVKSIEEFLEMFDGI